MFSPANYINKDFFLKDHGSKARKLAIEEFMNRLTDRIKLL
jgi:tRNA splicing endonuclease